jgi:hypothetical protein
MAARTGRERVGGMKKARRVGRAFWLRVVPQGETQRRWRKSAVASKRRKGGGRFRDDREIRDPGCSLEDERIRVEK